MKEPRNSSDPDMNAPIESASGTAKTAFAPTTPFSPGITRPVVRPVSHDAETIIAPDSLRDPERQSPKLGDRYHVGDMLGAGGMGEVRLFRDQWIGRDIAMKTLLPDLLLIGISAHLLSGCSELASRRRRRGRHRHRCPFFALDASRTKGRLYAIRSPARPQRVVGVGSRNVARALRSHAHGREHHDGDLHTTWQSAPTTTGAYFLTKMRDTLGVAEDKIFLQAWTMKQLFPKSSAS